jgi:hypothetical protein
MTSLPTASTPLTVALARVEARKILLHPAVLLFAVLSLPLMGLASNDLDTNDLSLSSDDLALAVVPLGWAMIVVANLAALRSRRHGTGELYEAAPATAGERSGGLLLGLGALVPLTAVALVAGLLLLRTDGFTGWPPTAELAAGVLWVVGGGALGVLAARWLPHPLVAAPLVVATPAVAGLFRSTWMGRWTWMGFYGRSDIPDLSVRPATAHAVYLAATVAIAAGLALAGRAQRRTVALLLGPAVAVALVAAALQTRPPAAAKAEEIAQRLMTEEAVQPCEVRALVRYCGRPLGTNIAGWEPTVQAVLRRTPPPALATGLVVSQRRAMIESSTDCAAHPVLRLIDPVIERRVDPLRVWPADGRVHPRAFPIDDGCGGSADGGLVVGAMTAAWAVGLPPSQSAATPACDAGGQARAVVALWLAAQVSPVAADGLRGMVDLSRGPVLASDWSTPPTWGVAWRADDAKAALALLERPVDDVTTALAAVWIRILDPSTPAAAVGLGSAGLAAPIAGVPRCP